MGQLGIAATICLLLKIQICGIWVNGNDLRDSTRSVTLAQIFATVGEERMEVGPLIVWIGPPGFDPLALVVVHRHFRENPVSEIDSVVSVLSRGQHQFGFCDITGVNIERP